VLVLSMDNEAKQAAMQAQATAYEHRLVDWTGYGPMWSLQLVEGVDRAATSMFSFGSNSSSSSSDFCSQKGSSQLTVLGDNASSSSYSSGYGSDEGSDDYSCCCSSSYAPAAWTVSDAGAGKATAAAAELGWPLATAATTKSCPLLGADCCSSTFSDDSCGGEAYA
jgi:hypothetical protein